MFFINAYSRGRTILRLALFAALIALAAAPAHAAEIRGRATIIDAGTIEVGARRIRLAGIEAPAPDQVCSENGRPWNCGQQATWALAYELAEHWLICRDTDTMTGVCFIGGIHDVGEIMVRKGWARAAPHGAMDYRAVEAEARANRAGMWRGGAP